MPRSDPPATLPHPTPRHAQRWAACHDDPRPRVRSERLEHCSPGRQGRRFGAGTEVREGAGRPRQARAPDDTAGRARLFVHSPLTRRGWRLVP